jgi:PAS domain S-box-containing protein
MTLLPAEFRPKPGQGVIITDQDGVVLQANQAILEELGYEAKDIERKNASQLFLEPPVLLEPLAWLGHPAKPLRYRARLRTSSKEAVPFDVITYSVGHPPSAIAIHVLRKAKVRPERAAPPLPSVEDILDSIPLPSIVLVDAHVAFANKKASELTGHARHDLLKKRFADLFTSESRQVLEETWARLAALEQGESMSLSVQVLREDQAINVRADFSALQWEEKRALLCTFSEVAPHVEAAPPERPEELERKITSERLEALLNTAASLSHYVNNMLVGILTSCSLLRSELPADDPVAERLQLIHESSTRITSLMRSLQRFARGLPPQRSSIDLPHLTRNVIQQVYTARGESFEPQVEIDPSTPATLADADVLTIALRNVIQNAAEASPQGGKVEVSLQPVEITEEALLEHPTARPGSYAHIRVRDYGPGISPDLLPRIIEPFVTDKFGHMGLGLSETYGIVTAYGGFMEITSTPGTGTTVDLYLPSAAVVSKEAEIPAEATRIVLVITEDAALLEATSAALHQAGYDMVPATSVAEGVDIFSRYQADIDLILLDLTAEHLNGERVLRFFQRIHAGAPVAVVTNVIDDTEAAALIAEGALDVIRKPFTAEGLLSRLQALLRPQQCGEASLDASNQT